MDLKSGYPFWAVKNGLMYAFPPLDVDLSCEVVVMGAGITGALIADELAAHGHDVVVLDKRDVCWGSTSASTALLQYEIDTHATDLVKRYDQDAALLAYQSSLNAVSEIGQIAQSVGDVDFGTCESLYYASNRKDHPGLVDEFAWRETYGFPVRWLNRAALKDEYGLTAPSAILSTVAARVDPYRLASRLLHRMQQQGARVFDRTEVTSITDTERSVRLTTDNGISITAKYVVIANGYESQQWLRQRVAKNLSSYAYISDPVDPDELGWLADTMLWESSRPYIYLRATGDGRLLVGGEDDEHDMPARRDRSVDRKAATLQRKVSRLFPHLHAPPAFAWAGTFAETSDGLPLFGHHPEYGARVLFALAYGGNGITYSMLGAGLLRAQIEHRRHPLTELFAFARLGNH
ncbi:NAD(P)/FAD-dependent oxidoreductase [Halomonas urumqiensis]|uniref:Amino acid oxidase n=1 Tax=Halomonas urumqiensis TaxID=1684789 RepID=A0A2N7UNZ9_9GAMM|nr:FAD-dependent oxidoreductase [Halomonas urumqiensis]PMR82164.1 amino acid oxidase [Halomonas urumqiensis]PTB03060.1 FAD-binding oxidoreductase [Halomonas urumqiensis]GHE20809.1 oxidoreductase [Halomonas urumqiensis]